MTGRMLWKVRDDSAKAGEVAEFVRETLLDTNFTMACRMLMHNFRCSVHTVSDDEIRLEGWQVETGVPTMIEPIDPVTGQALPACQLLPNPGWGNGPGDWKRCMGSRRRRKDV